METNLNKHLSDFRCDFTLEFDVKIYSIISISDEDYNYELKTGNFINSYAERCFNEIKNLKYNWIKDWTFAGRSNGWFVLLCKNKKTDSIRPTQIIKIKKIVEKYYINYTKELEKNYNN